MEHIKEQMALGCTMGRMWGGSGRVMLLFMFCWGTLGPNGSFFLSWMMPLTLQTLFRGCSQRAQDASRFPRSQSDRASVGELVQSTSRLHRVFIFSVIYLSLLCHCNHSNHTLSSTQSCQGSQSQTSVTSIESNAISLTRKPCEHRNSGRSVKRIHCWSTNTVFSIFIKLMKGWLSQSDWDPIH